MSDNTLIESGSIKFASRVTQALPLGEYRLKIESNISGVEGDTPAKTGILDLIIDCEHTFLPKDQVYSTYPPKQFSGDYAKCLPHIILQRCTIPWELKLSEDAPDNIPWLALLVFSEDEQIPVTKLKTDKPFEIPPKTFVPEIYKHINVSLEPEAEYIDTVDIPSELFAEILPLYDELPLLSHVRNVSLDDKVTDSSVTDGWFSCVVANRLPLEPKTSDDAPIGHTAHLVSLEGFEQLLKLNTNQRTELLKKNKLEQIRMFSLYSWEFHCTHAEMDFDVCAKTMKASAMQIDMQSIPDKSIESPDLIRVIQLGYTPVDHIMREGSTAVSWYRSPLIPQKNGNDKIPFGSFADALLRYDEELDMIDVTYSAAWQLGRLLAMQNQPFSSELVRWRMENKSRAATEHNRKHLRKICRDALKNEDSAEENAQPDIGTDGTDESEHISWKDFLHGMDNACGISDPLGIEGTELEQLVGLFDFKNTSDKMKSIYAKKARIDKPKKISDNAKSKEIISILRSLNKNK